ncbi:MAG: Oxidoreductase [Candidatus Nomurabacteria bacterium GW2011_GWA2_40_9]|uniref:Oxidoreductase n=1 Tax=Candidatus Nomurabacteria bacterium GW2011_GWA2_40_9 TaxID=1618734 RepID=A0A0G0WWS5_9BACT|nr:MAG: Oxidoreductase [Candidatus Nomurabacteria bacterium GW2011_GWA2_40_9]
MEEILKKDLKQEIQKFFKGDVEDGEETLSKYSRDASIFEIRPQLVLFPKDTEDVKSLVKWVSENCGRQDLPQLSITCRCAGTDMSGGAIGESIILDFTRYMNKLIAFSPLLVEEGVGGGDSKLPPRPSGTPPYQGGEENTITVEPGMFYRDFEKITLSKGMILPCYTASKSLNAMGGMYGNNSAGERTLKYGKTDNYILESKVVFGDGNEYVVKPLTEEELNKKISQNDFEGNIYKNIYELIQNNQEEIKNAKPKVHKNSAGYYVWNVMGVNTQDVKNSAVFTLPGVPGGTYADQDFSHPAYFDLNKLLVGSQGTLGIATEITFKLVPNPKYSKLVAVFMNDLAPLGNLVDEILELNPETLEAYDDKTMKLAVRFFPDFLKNKGFIGMIKFMWSFLPELGMTITGGFPKLILLAEFAGENNLEVQIKCKALQEKIKHFNLKVHITHSTAESNKYWDIRRESFALLRKHVAGKHTAPFIDDIIVRPEFLPKFIPQLNEILRKYDLTYTIAGHAGDGNFHIIPLMNFSRPDMGQIIMELSEKVYDLVLKYEGSITAEHNDGIIRTPFLQKMYGEKIIEIFKEIKNIFDLKYILNPGKKVPIEDGQGSKEFILSHIYKEHTTVHKV